MTFDDGSVDDQLVPEDDQVVDHAGKKSSLLRFRLPRGQNPRRGRSAETGEVGKLSMTTSD